MFYFRWLAKKEYKSVWGVGRHVLGSQIFDYWWDPTGYMVEVSSHINNLSPSIPLNMCLKLIMMMQHYTDGDTVNSDTPIGYGPAGDESLAVWGPDLPAGFLN